MANEPTSKTDDPAALAFSAVENALKDSVFAPEDADNSAKRSSRKREEPVAPSPDRRRSGQKIASQTSSVANDDRMPSAGLLYSLQSRSSGAPILIAAVLSIGWVALTGGIGFLRYSAELAGPGGAGAFFSSPEFAGLLALLALPVVGFFAVAILVRRAHELRVAAASMTQAAIRLTDPETTAADKVATVGQAVRREVNALGDGLERALSRAGELEVMVHNEVTALERTYSENETRLRALIQDLAEQRDAVIDNSDKVRTAIGGAHTAMIGDLQEIGATLSATITEHGAAARSQIESAVGNFQTLLDDRSGGLIAGIENRTTDMSAALDQHFERFDGLFGQRAGELAQVFESRTSNLASSIEARMDSLIEVIDGRAEVVSASIEDKTGQIAAAMAAGSDTMLAGLNEREESLARSLESLSQRVVGDIGGRTVRAEEVLTGLIERLEESMSIRVNAIESRFQSAIIEIGAVIEENAETARTSLSSAGGEALSSLATRVDEVSIMLDNRLSAMDGVVSEKGERMITLLGDHTQAFETRAGLLEAALDEKTGRLGDTLSERSQEFARAVDERTASLDSTLQGRTQAINEAFDTHLGGFVSSLDERTNLINASLAEKTENLSTVLDDRAASFGKMVENRSDEFSAAIEKTAGDLDEAMALRTAEFASTLETKTGEMSFAIDESTRALGEALGTQTRSIAERIATRTQQLSEALSTRTKEFGDVLANRTERFSESLSHETNHLSEALEARTQALSDEINTRTLQISTAIDSQGQALDSRVGEALTTVVNTMSNQANRVTSLIDGKIEAINANLGSGVDSAVERLGDVETGLTGRLASVSGKIVESAREAANAVESSVEHAREQITDMVDARLGTLPEAITARAEITADRLAELNQTLNNSLGKSMADLEAGADRIEETISTRISHATAQLSTDVEQTAARMDIAVRTALEQVKDAARHIEDLVEVKAVATAEQLGAQIGEMHKTVAEQSTAFSHMIETSTAQLNNSLRSHGNILKQALADSAGETEELMASTTGRVQAELGEALKRLNDSNLLLQRVLETTTTNLADLESKVASQTSSYSTTVKDALSATEQAGNLVSQHVDAFQQAIRSMSGEFAELVSSLDGQASNIDRAATSLTEAGNFSIDTLENRRGAMEALAQSFTARADEIDERMRTFATSIAETVSDTEQRLVAARRAMESALEGTSQAVTEGIETFSLNADQQSRRANQILSDAQQNMLGEMQATLDEATRRFNETAAAMRATAGQVGHELEATRSELQRGVLELPEETRASAAAMRRVVAEQIEALNELNSIVRSQSGTHDVSTRRQPRREEPAPAPRRTETRLPEPRREEPRPIEARQPMSRPNATPASTADIATALEGVMGATETRSAPRQPVAPRDASAERNGGWLRDVLRNASASQASAPRQSGLSGLSGEIARSIEDAALNEAWQRYQAGESGVFSRRIYTLSGQGVYDEVRRKFQRDPDFAQTANAYMEEFEQFLRRAASGPQAESETRAMLLGERGKVYTMLAHAAGRLA